MYRRRPRPGRELLSMKKITYYILLAALMTLGAGSARAATAKKDKVEIDQKDYNIVGMLTPHTMGGAQIIHIILKVKLTLGSLPKGFLRAGVNLDGPTKFRPMFSAEASAGTTEREVDVQLPDNELPEPLRVVVWLDKQGDNAPIRPLASDNIAFDAKVLKKARKK